MNEFTRYSDARARIKSGYVCLLRRGGLIGWATKGPSHAMLTVIRKDSPKEHTLSIVEAREWYGVRCVTLLSQVRAFPGLIDVYEPIDCPAELRERAATIAFRQCGLDYSYGGLILAAWMVIRWILTGRRFLRIEPPTDWGSPKFCSFLCAWSYWRASAELHFDTYELATVEPGETIPADLAKSPHLRLVASGLVPDEWMEAA